MEMWLFFSACLSMLLSCMNSNSTSCDHNFCYTCVKCCYIQVFFYFYKILSFCFVRMVKEQKIAKRKNENYIYSQRLHLRNSDAYDHDFWYTCVRWWHLVFFSFSQNFDFLGCQRGKRAKNGPKWQKIIFVRAPYLRSNTWYVSHYDMCV